jgi:hypothetical protein
MKIDRKKRISAGNDGAPDSFRRQHGGVAHRKRVAGDTANAVYANEAESPLAWLARRKGLDGRPFISLTQLARASACVRISHARVSRRA